MSVRSLTTPGGTSVADLRAKLNAATLALHESLDAVMTAFDRHSQELDALRRALNDADASLQASTPGVAPLLKPMAPLPTMPEISPQRDLQPRPAMAQPLAAAMAAPPTPPAGPRRPPSGPMMTQILWPSKDNALEPVQPSASAPPQAAVPMAPRRSDVPMKISAPPPVEAQAPDLEQATLEELNAALAYAFSQVSNTTSLGKGAVTQMMPAHLPTQALRYGQPPDLSGRY